MVLRLVAAASAATLLAACTPAAMKPILNPGSAPRITAADPKENCLVGGLIAFPINARALQEVAISAGGNEIKDSGSENAQLTDSFAVVVPKGPYQVVSITYEGGLGNKRKKFLFSPGKKLGKGQGWAGVEAGDMPELAGECQGGFVWLGEFKGDVGGTFSSPSLKKKAMGPAADGALAATREAVKGTAWEPLIKR